MSVADAKRGLEIVDRWLEQVTAGEKVYWRPRLNQAPPRSLQVAHLLPVFDEFFVAYKDRQVVFNPRDGKPSLTSWDLLGPTIVIDGIAVGNWKRSPDKKTIDVKAIRDLKKPERAAVAAAAARYAEFSGLDTLALFW